MIRRRVDAYGLKEPRIQPVGDNRILVQIPGSDASDVARVRSIITRIGRLEFRIVADKENNASILNEAETTGKEPTGWHWYTLEKEDSEVPGKTKSERVLVDDTVQLTGEGVDTVGVGYGGEAGTEMAVHVSFRDRNAFWDLTSQNKGRRLAILLDDLRDANGKLIKIGRAHSAPVIKQAIPGNAEITGGFTQETAEDLKSVLQSGSLKVPLEAESEQYVGPYQGLKSIEDGKAACVIGLVVVLAFILVYYLKAGLVADFALILNLLLLVGALALRGATLTLPGIAGIVLTIGMAVDSNVLIFERIREEMKKMADKPLLKCLRDGHHRALSAIVDSNLTTLITALILYQFGTGPVRGFAVTLSYGIIISVFTAVVVVRLILEAAIKCGALKKLVMFDAVKVPHVQFVAIGKYFTLASAIVIVAGSVYFFVAPGRRFGIDFSSGTLIELNLQKKVDAEVVRARLNKEGYADVEVQEIAATRGLEAQTTDRSSFAIRLRRVASVTIKKAGFVTGGAKPEVAGWAEVIVEADHDADPAEMALRLREAGSPNCVIEKGAKQGSIVTYTVRSSDKLVSDLESNVRNVFGNELIAGDIRRAFKKGPGAESLLADEGIQLVSEDTEKLVVRIALSQARTPASVAKVIADRLRTDPDVRPEGALADGKAKVLLVTAAPGTLPQIKDALKVAGVATLEPFGAVTTIHPTVAAEMKTKAAVAVILSLLAIIAYMWFRFEFRWGLATVVALLHDVIITVIALALTGREISLNVIAALLTIIGYSVNDTIVIFDRIRENRRTVRKTSFADIADLSINQTLSRTILTALTTFLAVLVLYVFGGAAIDDFAFAMLVGVIAGCYSTVFIATPVLLWSGEDGALRGPLSSVPSTRTARPLEGLRASS